MQENHKIANKQQLTENKKIDFAKSLAISLQEYPELTHLIKVWPELPEQVKTGILAMVRACEKSE